MSFIAVFVVSDSVYVSVFLGFRGEGELGVNGTMEVNFVQAKVSVSGFLGFHVGSCVCEVNVAFCRLRMRRFPVRCVYRV